MFLVCTVTLRGLASIILIATFITTKYVSPLNLPVFTVTATTASTVQIYKLKTEVNYTVNLTSHTPAVLDSTLVFTALLSRRVKGSARGINSPFARETDKDLHQPLRKIQECIPGDQSGNDFVYEWLNTADGKSEKCLGSTNVTLQKTFYSENVLEGNYLMLVVVHPVKHQDDIITYNAAIFQLTKNLNGNLNISQHLAYQRNCTVFAVAKSIDFTVILTDNFMDGMVPTFHFRWYNGSSLLRQTMIPVYLDVFSSPGLLALEVQVFASLPSGKVLRSTYKQELFLKEMLRNCSMTRLDGSREDQSVKLGDKVLLTIDCSGSSPSAVCWSATGLRNNTCTPPPVFQNTTTHTLILYFNTTGWTHVYLLVYNDVSVQQLQETFYVYSADSVNSAALVVPAIFICIGIIIVLVWTAYTVRLRRQLSRVEVADFDFDPRIRSASAFTSVAHAVKLWLRRFLLWFRSYRSVSTDEHDFNTHHLDYDDL